MSREKNGKKIQTNVKAKLGGMDLYGTTGNVEIDGYKMSGDIENAGQLDKGFKRETEHSDDDTSISGDRLPVGENEDVQYDPAQADENDREARQRAIEADERTD